MFEGCGERLGNVCTGDTRERRERQRILSHLDGASAGGRVGQKADADDRVI